MMAEEEFDPDEYLKGTKQPSEEPKESFGKFLSELKQGHLINAGHAFPGSEKSIAAMTGALGPVAGAAPALAALLNKGQGGTFGDRLSQAQAPLRHAMENNPGSAAAGGLIGSALAPVPSIPGGASGLGKIGAGIANGALQGGAQSAGLGYGATPGALAGGAIGGLGGAIGAGISKLANSEMLSPLLNRLKYLKPTAEEAQPLSEAGGKLREAISDTGSQGLWSGLPSRESMLGRLRSAQQPQGQKIEHVLNQAEQSRQGPMSPVNWSGSEKTLQDLASHSASSGDNLSRLQSIGQQESQNVAGASSLPELNRAKQALYAQTYTPNRPEMGNFLPGRDQLLRSMGRDVKNSILDQVNTISNIDPKVDAQTLANANQKWGTLQTIINPLNRAIGKEISGPHDPNIRIGTTGHAYGALSDILSLGGRTNLAKAHAGELFQGADKTLSKYQPSQAVARAFISGTTPGLNQEQQEEEQ